MRRDERRAMRYPAILIITLGLAACSAPGATQREPQTVSPAQGRTPERAVDSVVEFLVAAAATDFHTHRPPDPVRFRDVRLGHHGAGGNAQYLLCGQFLPSQ